MHLIRSATAEDIRRLQGKASVFIFSGFGEVSSRVCDIVFTARDALMTSPAICDDTLLAAQAFYHGCALCVKVDRDWYDITVKSHGCSETIFYGQTCRELGDAKLWDLIVLFCDYVDRGTDTHEKLGSDLFLPDRNRCRELKRA